uniref:F-box domain-containing protein n=1 Tax=Caenorhabditis tropicalis TaxID=1561998 RepID=A0A1I7UT50_9PELO
MTSPFYLFRLPQLVYSMIINSMTVTEQILLSLCSLKTNSIVKYFRRDTRKITLNVRNNALVTVVVEGSNEQLRIGQMLQPGPVDQKVTINGKSKRFGYSKLLYAIGTYWDDMETGTMEVIEYLDKLLSAKVEILEISDESGGRIMNWLQRRQRQISKVIVFNQRKTVFEVESLSNIIRDCEAKHICLDVNTGGKPFEIQNSHGKCVLFQCKDDTVISVENLMQIEAPEIYLTNRRYTDAEIDLFLRHWMNGGNPNLKALFIPHLIYDGVNVASNLPVSRRRGDKRYRSVIDSELSFSMYGGYKIKRNDGTIARFYDDSEDFFCFALEKVLH